jgi:hypothetical protein
MALGNQNQGGVGAQFIRDAVVALQIGMAFRFGAAAVFFCADSPLGAWALSGVKHAENLKAITTYTIGDQIGPVGYRPFACIFDSAFASHGGELGQFVYAGEDRIGEVVSSF